MQRIILPAISFAALWFACYARMCPARGGEFVSNGTWKSRFADHGEGENLR